MPARPSPAKISSDLRVPERIMLFCLASGTDWERAGVTHATAQQLLVRGLIDRDQSAGRFKTDTARARGARRIAQAAGRRAGWIAMPYDPRVATGQCTVCASPANILKTEFRVGVVVNCSRCGDFAIDHVIADDLGLPLADQKKRALASHVIRKMQTARRPHLSREF